MRGGTAPGRALAPRASALLPCEDALLRFAAAPLPPRSLPLEEAIGKVLAEPMVVPHDVPSRSLALRAGVAVEAASTAGASPYLPALARGPLLAVAAGDALPEGCDAVLPRACCMPGPEGTYEISQAASPGEDVRRPGEDFVAGAVIGTAGRLLTPREAGLAAAAGITACHVRVPRVVVVGIDGPAIDYARGRLAAAGAQCLAADEAAGADFTIAVGCEPGDASDGTADSIVGDAPSFPGIAMRPGEGARIGSFEGRPLLLLPDRFEVVCAALLLIAEPILRRLAAALPPVPLEGRLTQKIASAIGLTDLVLLASDGEGFGPVAVGDVSLAALARAEFWLAVAPGSEGFGAGARTTVFAL